MKVAKKILKIIWKIITYIILIFLALLACFLIFYIGSQIIAKGKNERPLISLFTIVSPSMEPTIMVNDVIFDERVNSENDLGVGDIITFYSETIDTGGYTVTHRIYKKYTENGITYFETKGDNNVYPDSGRIVFSDIVGKYKFKINGLGNIQYFVASKWGWILIILIPCLIFITSDIFKLINAYKIKKDLNNINTNINMKRKKELDDNKKVRALIEKANRNNKK